MVLFKLKYAYIKLLFCVALSIFVVNNVLAEPPNFSLQKVDFLFFATRVIFSLFVLSVLCFSVFNIEKFYKALRASGVRNILLSVLYGIYFSSFLISLFNPLDPKKIAVKIFKREIGVGLISDYDITLVIGNFFKFFLLFATFFFLIFLAANYFMILPKSDQQKKAIACLNNLAIVGGMNLIFRGITYFDDSLKDVFSYSSSLLCLISVAFVLYLLFEFDEKGINVELFSKLMFIANLFAIPVSVSFNEKWDSGKLLIIFQVSFTLLLIILLGHKPSWFVSFERVSVWISIAIVFSLVPFFTSFYIELINILNQYGIFVVRLRRYYVIGFLLLIIGSVLLAWLSLKRRWELLNWKKWLYPWVVFGVSCLMVQCPLQKIYSADLFESANYSVPISEFLNFGKIPVVETLGHHMMLGVWEGMVYAFLNNDKVGAIFTPYADYRWCIVAVLFYFLLKEIWCEEGALYGSLFFPLSGFQHFGLGILVCLATISYVKKSSYFKGILVWGSIIWCALYLADIGYSFGLACIIALFIYAVREKRWDTIKPLLVSLFFVLIIVVATWFALCSYRHISPFVRLREFLDLFKAEINWAYATMGDNRRIAYSWGYLFVPLTIIVSLLYVMFFQKFKETVGLTRWVLLLVLGLAFFVNFPRGLTRHNLAENTLLFIIWTGYLYLSLFISCVMKKRSCFLPLLAAFILCNSLLLDSNIGFADKSMLDMAVNKVGAFTDSWTLKNFEARKSEEKTYWEQLYESKKIVNRVEWSDLKKDISSYKFISDNLLESDETFLDFTYTSFIYSALNRRNPVYVAQVPTMLSGEFTQKCFVQQIERNREQVPIAFMPNITSGKNSMDGILLNYKYYKVAEFIYKNYRPLSECEKFSVWCLNTRYNDMLKKLSQLECHSDLLSAIFFNSELVYEDCDIFKDTNSGQLILKSTGKDPRISGLQKCLDMSKYQGQDITIQIKYHCLGAGDLQLYYTTERDEIYKENQSIKQPINNMGVAKFSFHATNDTKIRFDIPERCIVNIQKMDVFNLSRIDWGYDGPTLVREYDTTDLIYESPLHNYQLSKLPVIWGEKDIKNAAGNNVVCKAQVSDDGIYEVEKSRFLNTDKGNYLMLKLTCAERETQKTLVVKAGNYEQGAFWEKYRYSMDLEEGTHCYLLRISSDYYWQMGDINAFCLQSEADISNVEVNILTGD